MHYFVDSTDVGVILTSAINLMLLLIHEIEYCWHNRQVWCTGKTTASLQTK